MVWAPSYLVQRIPCDWLANTPPLMEVTKYVVWQAIAWMALTGIGIALVNPASSSLLADMFPESSRGTAFGIMFFVGNLGAPLACIWQEDKGLAACRLIL